MAFLSVSEIAKKYRTTNTTVLSWIKKGLPAIKVGKFIRIEEDDLEKFIADQSAKGIKGVRKD